MSIGAFLAKTVVVLSLAAAILGGAAYYTYELFIRPEKELKEEKALPPTPPPKDTSLPEYEKAVATLDGGDLLGAREAFSRFVEQNPRSTKIEDAKNKLGKINTDIFLSPRPAPEKQIYVVRPGDAVNKVARITKTTPELLMRANGLTSINLQINQRLLYSPADFAVIIHKKDRKVVLRNRGKFFKQYAIRTMPGGSAKKEGAAASKPLQGKIVEKIAFGPNGKQVIFTDKEFHQATFWITHTIPGHTIYSDPDPSTGQPANKPPQGGVGLAPEDTSELAAMVIKNTPVTLEN